jgi:hypothetical protein
LKTASKEEKIRINHFAANFFCNIKKDEWSNGKKQPERKERYMDPITAALMAALAAGATQVGKSAVVDSYNGVKALIKKKFEKTDLPAAIENLEKKPDSKSRQGMVQEEVETASADKDPEIMSTVQALVDAVKNTPDGQKVISKYNLNIRGSDIGVIGDNADIKGGIHFGKK